MDFIARAKNIRVSPFKLRPIVDVVRGKNVNYALGWLATAGMAKVVPVKKLIQSAVANAKSKNDVKADNLFIKEIKVDQGPTFKYSKPGSMGRSVVMRKRLSHISVVLQNKEQKAKEDNGGTKG